METKTIATLHEEHLDWLRQLDFYKDEIRILQERVAEVAAKNSSKEILALIEHFQNQFILQKENIDELHHAVKDHEDYLDHRADENHVAGVSRKVNDHPRTRERIKGFEKNINALRLEVDKFLEKTM